MKFKTSITEIKDGREIVYGHDLQELAREKNFVEVIYLLLNGQLPTPQETRMLNVMLTATIDHGPGTVSAQTARIVASAKNDVQTSIGAGILAMGAKHGGAIEPAMEFFYKHANEEDVATLVADLKAKKVRIPGYGHAVLSVDHRADTIFETARETGFFGKHCELALQVHEELNKISSKQIPLNVDGAKAAVLCDMGFPSHKSKGVFIIARIPGLVAQVIEEIERNDGLRRLKNEDVEFISQ